VGDANNYPKPTSQRQPGSDPLTPWVCVCSKGFATEKGMNIHMGRMKCGSLLSQDLRKGQPNNTVEEPDQDNHHRVWSLTNTNSATARTMTEDAAQERMVTAANRNDTQQTTQDTLLTTHDTLLTTQDLDPLFNISQESEQPPDTQPQPSQGSEQTQVVDGDPIERINWPASNMKAQWSQFETDARSTLTLALAGTAERKMEVMSRIIYTMGHDRFGLVKKKSAPKPSQLNQRQQKIATVRGEIRQLTKR